MYRVKNPKTIAKALSMCRVAGGTAATVRHVPFETPCSIDRDTRFPPAADLVVARKADGVRYYLVLTVCDYEEGTKPVALLVNRADEVYSTHVRAPRSWYHAGTVYDGEMCTYLPDKSKRLFLVFNVLMHRGAMLFSTPYNHRLGVIAKTVPAEVLATAGARDVYGAHLLCSTCDSIVIAAKQCVPAVEMMRLVETPSTNFETDGLIFTPIRDAMTTGRAPRLLKWKASNTIDVRLVVDNNRFELEAATKGTPIPLSRVLDHTFALGPRLEQVVRGARLFGQILGKRRVPFDEIVELDVIPGAPAGLRFLRIRRDKTTPNDAYTIERTAVAAESWITPEALAAVIGAA